MAKRTIIHSESSKREYRKFFGVLLFIFFAATLMSTLVTISLQDWLRWYVGSALLVFGGFKLISFESFLEVFPLYDPLAARFRWYNYMLPIVEVLLGLFYILDLIPSVRYILTFIIFGFSLMGMYTNLNHRGPTRDHTWLGKAFRLPMSTAMLFEDIIVTVGAIILVVWGLFS
jgi:hypothetical protein